MAPSLVEVLSISTILAMPFLYETSKAFRYCFKFFVYYAVVMIVAVFVIPIMAFRAGDVTNLLKQCSLNEIQKLSVLQPNVGLSTMQAHLKTDRAAVDIAR